MNGRALAAGTLAVVALVAVPAAATDWRERLERAGEAATSIPYRGEALWITFSDERPYVSTVTVAADGAGGMVVDAPERHRLGVAGDDLGFAQRAEGWMMPLPAALEDTGSWIGALEDNYEVRVEGTDRVMDRTSTMIALHKSGGVRERLWLDEATGLLLRRETYGADGALIRMAAYLSLDLDPPPAGESDLDAFEERLEGVMPVDESRLSALREAGWTVLDRLPGGFEAVGAYAMSAEGSQPLHMIYADGLYTVSVFQQAGSPDWDTLPGGARKVEALPGSVYEWPGALPHRLVWVADGRTWLIVGDAPPDDLLAIAGAFPQAEEPDLLTRLGRGFSRLWSWVTQWGR